jgi:1-acyl-sn-glycerol-3-phosphate acyltransferase
MVSLPFVFPMSQSSASNPSPNSSIERSRCSPWMMPLVYFLGRRLVMPTYFKRIEVLGQENLPTSGPVILAPTHRSRWDALIVPYGTGRGVTGRDLRFMVSADEVKGFQGWFIKRLGGFAVNTRRPSITTLRHGIDLLQQEQMLVIFPEGGIFRDAEVHPLKPGLARLALQAENSAPDLKVQVVPIGLTYSPSFPRWGAKVKMHIGQPLPVADYAEDSTKAGSKRLTADLDQALAALLKSTNAENAAAEEAAEDAIASSATSQPSPCAAQSNPSDSAQSQSASPHA